MKNILSLTALFIFFFIVQCSYAQIPNGGFENWTGGNPDGWTTNNVTGYLELVTQSNDAHSGSSSAKMEMKIAMSSLMQPVLFAGPFLEGIPVTQRHSTLNFYYKYAPTTSTVYLTVVVGMYKSGTFIGSGVAGTKNSASSYTKLTAQISYFDQSVPDKATIYITLIDSFFNLQSAGTIALLDDIYFDQPTDVKDQESFNLSYSLSQNYPNPFNPSTKISWQLPSGCWQTLKVYDVLGNEIAVLVDEYKPAGSYETEWNIANLPSGVYIYQLRAGDFVQTKKMVLLR